MSHFYSNHKKWISKYRNFYFSVSTLEEDVLAIVDKEGWITRNEFIKYSMDTDLCKTDIQDRVFNTPVWGSNSSDNEPKKKSKDLSKKDSRKVSENKGL